MNSGLKVKLSPSKKVYFISLNEGPSKNDGNVLQYLEFYVDFFGHVGERFDKKVKVNFKIYDVTTWFINNCDTHIVQCLKK